MLVSLRGVVFWGFCALFAAPRHSRPFSPPINTVPPPHWAKPQPNLGPFSARSLRRIYSSGVAVSTSRTRALPFTSREIRAIERAPSHSADLVCPAGGRVPALTVGDPL